MIYFAGASGFLAAALVTIGLGVILIGPRFWEAKATGAVLVLSGVGLYAFAVMYVMDFTV